MLIAPHCHPPGLLAFDTSTGVMAVAAAGPAGEVTWCGPGGAEASTSLLPRVHAVLDAAGLALDQVEAIAFGRGPGAFTGLRTSCAAAQGLAFGLGRPVLAVDSLSVVAEDTPWREGRVWVAMDARMDEVYAAAYVWRDGRWHVEVAPALYTLAALAQCWAADPPTQVAGTALAAFGDRLPSGTAIRQDQERNRGAALLRCAQAAWQRGEDLDPADALPMYLRDKVAFTTAERSARRAQGLVKGPA